MASVIVMGPLGDHVQALEPSDPKAVAEQAATANALQKAEPLKTVGSKLPRSAEKRRKSSLLHDKSANAARSRSARPRSRLQRLARALPGFFALAEPLTRGCWWPWRGHTGHGGCADGRHWRRPCCQHACYDPRQRASRVDAPPSAYWKPPLCLVLVCIIRRRAASSSITAIGGGQTRR